MMSRVGKSFAVLLVLCCAAFAGVRWLGGARPPAVPAVECRAELRSWVVAGRGRHLYLEIMCPEPYSEYSGRVEFTSVALRPDYDFARDTSGMARVGRMRGGHLGPSFALAPPPDNRLEAVYVLSVEQARCLARDRVYSEPYVLLGSNSNAGLRRAFDECGVRLPEAVLASGGVLGEFPGLLSDVGPEVLPERLADFGVVPTEGR